MVNWLIGKSVAGDMRVKVENINAYLVDGTDVYVESRKDRLQTCLPVMVCGNMPNDGGHLLLTEDEMTKLIKSHPAAARFVKPFVSAKSTMTGEERYCIWIRDEEKDVAETIPQLQTRMEAVKQARLSSCTPRTHPSAKHPHRFYQVAGVCNKNSLIIPEILAKSRKYLPVYVAREDCIVGGSMFFLRESNISPMAAFSILSSRCHMVWAEAVGGRLATGVSYSNILLWNTFPSPEIHDGNTAILENSARKILDVRKLHADKTLGYIYTRCNTPHDLKEAHLHNDSVTDKIILGKECQSDKERLALLLSKYQEMTVQKPNNAPTLQSLF